MTKSAEIYRQGDVLIRRVASIPTGAKPVARDAGRVILAYGEVTGHAHQLVVDGKVPTEKDVKLTAAESATFVRLFKKAQLVHEEHATITLAPGAYEVVRQREYTPTEIRRVAD